MEKWSSQESDEVKSDLQHYDPEKSPEKISELFKDLIQGLMAFPLNILGTMYDKCIKAEHEAILKIRENPNSPLTWNDYKSMTFTLQVINETLRLANISPGWTKVKDVKMIRSPILKFPNGFHFKISARDE
ncbi:unnamed protein product [Ilex paraguariensis]|uniref:Cytochrome P450 n=1 Tax=Ilex paraguariensis TaxID=185542 RepID=A0ABC8SYY3_9AQUA